MLPTKIQRLCLEMETNLFMLLCGSSLRRLELCLYSVDARFYFKRGLGTGMSMEGFYFLAVHLLLKRFHVDVCLLPFLMYCFDLFGQAEIENIYQN